MSTFLLRLAAPMQSWGVNSKFDRRYTGRTPSKSGVIGLCAAALGYRRDEDEKIAKLAGLKFGVRTDKPGKLLKDYHAAHEEKYWNPDDRSKINKKLSQEKKNKYSYVTTRYYLTDAVFVIGLEGDEEFLREIDAAIHAPMFPLYLGRRSCPPEGRVYSEVVADSLREALKNWRLPVKVSSAESGLRIDIDASEGGYLLRDLPRSFNPEHRKFDYRCVYRLEAHMPLRPGGAHDALGELEVP